VDEKEGEKKMKCPECGNETKNKIVQKETARGLLGTYDRRRHICRVCTSRWSTYELSKEKYSQLIKEREELVELRRKIRQAASILLSFFILFSIFLGN
jgi:transcriptional regulator NrdR family protein